MAAELDGKKNAGTSRMGTCGKGIVFVACCVASASALAATVTLNGETTYNVASGTNTVSDTLTGSGSILKTGSGALNLTGVGNDFTGGTKVNAGAVQASALDALGSGSVEVAAKTAGVWFNVAPATTGGYTLFGNALTFTGPDDCSFGGAALGVDRLGDSSGDGARNAIFFQNTHLTNSISGTRSYRLRHNPKNTGGPLNGGPSTIFDGPLSVAEGKGIFLNVYGTMTINGPITATILSGGEAWSGGGYLDLNNPANRIGRMYVASDRVRCGDTNVLRGAELVWRVTCEGLGATDCAWVDLCGHNQTVAALRQYIFGGSATAGWNKTRWEAEDNRKGISVKSDQPATLTITGMADDKEACTMVRGAVSLVLDAQDYPSFTQTFTHFKSAFTGTTTVRKGTLRITGKARFTGTPSITVEPGAAFVNASTNTQPSLANVTNLVVRGTFDASTATLNPFVKTLKNLEIASGATLKLPEGSLVNAQSVTLGGQTFTSGHLTADRLAALSGATVSGITVVVGNGEAVNWTGAVSESFSTAGNWNPALASADDLTFGSLLPTFASSGARATVDADAMFAGMVFRAAAGQTGFTLARDAATPPHGLTVFRGPVGAYTNDAACSAHTYTVDAPLALEGPVTFHADTNQTLVLRNAFHDTEQVQGRVLTIDGGGVSGNSAYGKVVFAGTRLHDGPVARVGQARESGRRLHGKSPGRRFGGDPPSLEQRGLYQLVVELRHRARQRHDRQVGACRQRDGHSFVYGAQELDERHLRIRLLQSGDLQPPWHGAHAGFGDDALRRPLRLPFVPHLQRRHAAHPREAGHLPLLGGLQPQQRQGDLRGARKHVLLHVAGLQQRQHDGGDAGEQRDDQRRRGSGRQRRVCRRCKRHRQRHAYAGHPLHHAALRHRRRLPARRADGRIPRDAGGVRGAAGQPGEGQVRRHRQGGGRRRVPPVRRGHAHAHEPGVHLLR